MSDLEEVKIQISDLLAVKAVIEKSCKLKHWHFKKTQDEHNLLEIIDSELIERGHYDNI